ncbi:MAG: M28 family peptidase [Candidatus Omnitrophica bacterium]|nr:M28 family peptidase [Candidatus Omnitrophota bacterium]
MRQDNPEQLGETSAREMLHWIEEIVKFGVRRPGYPGNLATEEYLFERFSEFGLLDIEKEPVPTNCWKPERLTLAIGEARDTIPCIGIPYTRWTPLEGIEAESVYVGEGKPEDLEGVHLEGKIVIFDARFGELSAAMLKQGASDVYDPDQNIPDGPLHAANWLITNFTSYYHFQVQGAAAVVGLLVDSPINGCSYYVPYDGYLKDLPAVWIGRDRANEVREAAQSKSMFHLTAIGKTPRMETHNIVGVVPGEGEEAILLTSHHDGPFASAVEDGSGLAVLLALARHFGALPGELERSLIFVASSGHFHGGIGNRVFVDRHKKDWLPKIAAALGVEHIANEVEEDGKGGYRLTGLPETRAIFTEGGPLPELIAEGVRKWNLDRSITVPPYLFGPEPPCDSAPYFTAGIPSSCLISGPLYLFDEFDTIDKVRSEDLENVLSFYIELIEKIDKVPMEELERDLTRGRNDAPADPPHWFLPPEFFLKSLREAKG